MGNNKALQILRGTRESIVDNKDIDLLAGQLLYNATDNTLTVGGDLPSLTDDTKNVKASKVNKLPIASREIKGYVKDI